VVATEVKELAQETAKATEDIARRVLASQGDTTAADSTRQALGQTRTAIDELSRMASDLRSTVGRFTY
jgi:methyl-accepting chemotaxis protein